MGGLKEDIERFLTGYGNGNGYGYGSGDGAGSAVKSISGYDVHMVDGVQTIITDIHGDVAKGFFLQNSLILKPCYIVKGDRKFAHGYTLREAWESLQSKILATAPTEDRISKFVEARPDKGKKYPAADLFEWHHRLTGSCLAGRKDFCSDHGIDITRDEFTIDEFVELTKGAYGGDIIKRLKGIA